LFDLPFSNFNITKKTPNITNSNQYLNDGFYLFVFFSKLQKVKSSQNKKIKRRNELSKKYKF